MERVFAVMQHIMKLFEAILILLRQLKGRVVIIDCSGVFLL